MLTLFVRIEEFFSLTININNLNIKTMKKLLLLAAAVAFGASAQTLTRTWKVETANALPRLDCRQGVGMNGKIYVNNKADQKVYVVDKDGVSATTLPGGTHCAIGQDQAGNLIVVNTAFPNIEGAESAFRVYKPQNPAQITELSLPSAFSDKIGRSDYIGTAKGDLTGDGELLLCGAKGETGIFKIVVAGGETSEDDSYVATTDNKIGVATNLNIIRPFMDGDVEKYLFVTRNAAPAIIVADDQGNFTTEKTMAWENKGACNGSDIFVLGGKKYVVYPTLPNYTDGFAIACLDVELAEGVKEYPAVATKEVELPALNNGTQTNWVNAEVVSNTEAIIYQYVPQGYCAAYSFKLPAEQTGINDVNAANDVKVRKVYENGQVYIIKGDVKYNVMGAQVK